MHRWVDHTSEVELRVEAGSEEAVFEESAAALAELLADEPAGEPRSVEVGVEARDRATQLADWLGELLFLSESEGFLPERVERLELGERRVQATVGGRTGSPRHLVKAVTYHGLVFERADGRWQARLVLDV